jgi:hypothetical protein
MAPEWYWFCQFQLDSPGLDILFDGSRKPENLAISMVIELAFERLSIFLVRHTRMGLGYSRGPLLIV